MHPALPILRRVLNKYGWAALYDGVFTDTGATLLSNFFYFYFYSFLRRKYSTFSMRGDETKLKAGAVATLTVLEELALGFVAGVASRAISTPLNLVTVRLQAERDESESEKGHETRQDGGVVGTMNTIYREHGLAGFWRGFSTTTALSLNPSITMTFFQVFRRVLALVQKKDGLAQADPSPGEAFVGGAVANAIATMILYPLILAKTLAQSSSSSAALNLRDALTSTGREGRSAYQGLDVQLLKACVSQGVTFMVKGRIEEMIVRAYLRRVRGRSTV